MKSAEYSFFRNLLLRNLSKTSLFSGVRQTVSDFPLMSSMRTAHRQTFWENTSSMKVSKLT